MMTLLTLAMAAGPSDTGDEARPLPLRLCEVFVQAMEGTGGAITLSPNEMHRMLMCATDDTAARLENLQEVIGHGPVADAAAAGTVVRADLAEDTGRWPILAPTVTFELGPVAMYAVPMRLGPDAIGVLSVYRRPESGPWRPPLDEVSVLADMIGAAIASIWVEDDAAAWQVRDRISQATGMVIGQLGIGPVDAVALMRAAAFSADVDLGQIATEIIEYRRQFRRDREGDQP